MHNGAHSIHAGRGHRGGDPAENISRAPPECRFFCVPPHNLAQAVSSQQPATTQPINLILPPSLSITEYNQIYPQHPQALKVYLPYIVSHLSLFPPYMAHSCPLSCYQLLSLRFTAHLFIASRPA